MVFASLSFTLEPSESLLLLGPNGSGKSSLLRLLAGLSRPATGELYWKGRPIDDAPERYTAAVRYVGHLDAIKPALSVAEALVFWGGLAGLGQQQVAEATARALTCFGLSAFADTPGRLLSAGQKRRVNLARLLLDTADLWLLDEPATALDQDSITALGNIIAAHRARGGMVILSTHMIVDLPQARQLDMRDFAFNPLQRVYPRKGSRL
ncbi:ABC transporter involved in cytochrome c biogenesis, ATPase component CcmA [invertebrate metagenome]|uniref:ABC transporter involved in cytochrome c biogenesis, ATPase component CcmA n=1 Tax=invertebrate metagenome TaxID=1711999 RepID=A0A484H5V6_9ZZZZ